MRLLSSLLVLLLASCASGNGNHTVDFDFTFLGQDRDHPPVQQIEEKAAQ